MRTVETLVVASASPFQSAVWAGLSGQPSRLMLLVAVAHPRPATYEQEHLAGGPTLVPQDAANVVQDCRIVVVRPIISEDGTAGWCCVYRRRAAWQAAGAPCCSAPRGRSAVDDEDTLVVVQARFLVLSNPCDPEPHIPSIPGQAAFGGIQVHAHNVLELPPLRGLRVLVVGAASNSHVAHVITALSVVYGAAKVIQLEHQGRVFRDGRYQQQQHGSQDRAVHSSLLRALAVPLCGAAQRKPQQYNTAAKQGLRAGTAHLAAAGPPPASPAACAHPTVLATHGSCTRRASDEPWWHSPPISPSRLHAPLAGDDSCSFAELRTSAAGRVLLEVGRMQRVVGEPLHFTEDGLVVATAGGLAGDAGGARAGDSTTFIACDAVVYCTGNRSSYSCLDEGLRQQLLGDTGTAGSNLYRHMVHPDIPNMAIVSGEVVTPDLAATAALQAEWVCALARGDLKLPPPAGMRRDVQRQRQRDARRPMPPAGTPQQLAATERLAMQEYHAALLRDVRRTGHGQGARRLIAACFTGGCVPCEVPSQASGAPLPGLLAAAMAAGSATQQRFARGSCGSAGCHSPIATSNLASPVGAATFGVFPADAAAAAVAASSASASKAHRLLSGSESPPERSAHLQPMQPETLGFTEAPQAVPCWLSNCPPAGVMPVQRSSNSWTATATCAAAATAAPCTASAAHGSLAVPQPVTGVRPAAAGAAMAGATAAAATSPSGAATLLSRAGPVAAAAAGAAAAAASGGSCCDCSSRRKLLLPPQPPSPAAGPRSLQDPLPPWRWQGGRGEQEWEVWRVSGTGREAEAAPGAGPGSPFAPARFASCRSSSRIVRASMSRPRLVHDLEGLSPAAGSRAGGDTAALPPLNRASGAGSPLAAGASTSAGDARTSPGDPPTVLMLSHEDVQATILLMQHGAIAGERAWQAAQQQQRADSLVPVYASRMTGGVAGRAHSERRLRRTSSGNVQAPPSIKARSSAAAWHCGSSSGGRAADSFGPGRHAAADAAASGTSPVGHVVEGAPTATAPQHSRGPGAWRWDSAGSRRALAAAASLSLCKEEQGGMPSPDTATPWGQAPRPSSTQQLQLPPPHTLQSRAAAVAGSRPSEARGGDSSGDSSDGSSGDGVYGSNVPFPVIALYRSNSTGELYRLGPVPEDGDEPLLTHFSLFSAPTHAAQAASVTPTYAGQSLGPGLGLGRGKLRMMAHRAGFDDDEEELLALAATARAAKSATGLGISRGRMEMCSAPQPGPLATQASLCWGSAIEPQLGMPPGPGLAAIDIQANSAGQMMPQARRQSLLADNPFAPSAASVARQRSLRQLQQLGAPPAAAEAHSFVEPMPHSFAAEATRLQAAHASRLEQAAAALIKQHRWGRGAGTAVRPYTIGGSCSTGVGVGATGGDCGSKGFAGPCPGTSWPISELSLTQHSSSVAVGHGAASASRAVADAWRPASVPQLEGANATAMAPAAAMAPAPKAPLKVMPAAAAEAVVAGRNDEQTTTLSPTPWPPPCSALGPSSARWASDGGITAPVADGSAGGASAGWLRRRSASARAHKAMLPHAWPRPAQPPMLVHVSQMLSEDGGGPSDDDDDGAGGTKASAAGAQNAELEVERMPWLPEQQPLQQPSAGGTPPAAWMLAPLAGASASGGGGGAVRASAAARSPAMDAASGLTIIHEEPS